MVTFFSIIAAVITAVLKDKQTLIIEYLALRQQLGVYRRKETRTPRLKSQDRIFWVFLSKIRDDWNCRKCQWLASQRWLDSRIERMLPVNHFHVVFTLPSQLRLLTMLNRTLLFSVLFESGIARKKWTCKKFLRSFSRNS